MGYDFSPRNRKAGDFYLGAFSWTWMLGAGVGLVIGYGDLGGGSGFVYQPREIRAGRKKIATSPTHNDGYPVSAAEAQAMAMAARGLVLVERYVRQHYDALPPEERARREAMSWSDKARPRMPVREDFVEKAEKFAEWAETSGGFTIR